MKKIILLLISVVAIAGCTPRQIFVPVIRDSIVEKTVRDTFISYLPQKQQVITIKKSHLETDLSFSDAYIDSLGLLNHSIENKGFIPSKTKETKIVVHDTIPYSYPAPEYYNIRATKIEKVYVRDFVWYSGFVLYTVLFIIILNKLNKKFKLWQKLTKGW